MLVFLRCLLRINHHSANRVLFAHTGAQNRQPQIWKVCGISDVRHNPMLDESSLHCVKAVITRKKLKTGTVKSCGRWYNSDAMTLVEITFELQSPLSPEQLRQLGEFANVYGLRRFRHDEARHQVTFEYDASRLRQSQVVAALAGANIAVTRIVPQSGGEIIPA